MKRGRKGGRDRETSNSATPNTEDDDGSRAVSLLSVLWTLIKASNNVGPISDIFIQIASL